LCLWVLLLLLCGEKKTITIWVIGQILPLRTGARSRTLPHPTTEQPARSNQLVKRLHVLLFVCCLCRCRTVDELELTISLYNFVYINLVLSRKTCHVCIILISKSYHTYNGVQLRRIDGVHFSQLGPPPQTTNRTNCCTPYASPIVSHS